MHILTLSSTYRKGEQPSKPERCYKDFIVSGKSLFTTLELGSDLDLIGTFGWTENKAEEISQLDQFVGLKASTLQTGRTRFYVCSNCGDIGCGAITAIIEITDTTVIWKDFGYETDYSEPELTAYKNIGPFIFEKQAYRNVLEEIRPNS